MGNGYKDVLEEAAEKLKVKGQRERYKSLTSDLDELLSGPSTLLGNVPANERFAVIGRALSHARKIWVAALEGYPSKPWLVQLLSLLALEEMAKADIELMRIRMSRLAERRSGISSNSHKNHGKKYRYVISRAALVNSRLDKVVGIKNVVKVLDMINDNALETLRQNSIYFRNTGAGVSFPTEDVSEDSSLFYLTLAGEVLAEIEPDPKLHHRMTKMLDNLEKEHPVSPCFVLS